MWSCACAPVHRSEVDSALSQPLFTLSAEEGFLTYAHQSALFQGPSVSASRAMNEVTGGVCRTHIHLRRCRGLHDSSALSTEFLHRH